MKLSAEFTIADDFPAVDYADWRKLVEADLAGVPFEKKLVTHTYEGIDVEPLYTRRDFTGEGDPQGFPGLPPFVRGSRPLGQVLSGVDLRQEYADPDIAALNQSIRADLSGGVTSVELRFDAAACDGDDPDDAAAAELAGVGGAMIYSADDLESALEGVDLASVGVAVAADAAFLPAAASLAAIWQRRGVPLDAVRGAFGADPIAVLARRGQLPVDEATALAWLTDLAKWTHEHCPGVRAVAVDTSVYHHAGATAVQDLAVALATGVAYLRAMAAAGMSVDAAARQFEFRLSLGTHHFLAIGKLRSARRLWGRVVEAAGGTADAGAMRIHARTSDRVLTERDPYVNILRNTAGMFAACVGGAEVVTSVPFDELAGLPDEFSRRVARNAVLVLQEESHLGRVIDPAGGSWFLETITGELAAEAWKFFQEIERRGGIVSTLASGWLSSEIDAAYAARAKDIARRKEGITGVSEFPNVAEERIVRPAPNLAALRQAAIARVRNSRSTIDKWGQFSASRSRTAAAIEAAERGATMGQLARGLGFHESPIRIAPLETRSFARPFEQLRDAADAWQQAHGHRPRVFLANMGPVAHHTARATYSKNFFEAGGFEVVTNDGFRDADAAASACVESGAHIAVICSSDKLYPEVVPALGAKLKAAGVRSVVLAGNPGDNETAWRAAGVDRFIFIKCDVLATLREMLREQGVLK